MKKFLDFIKKHPIISIASGFASFVFFIMFLTTQIPAGYGGVVYSMSGGVEKQALSQGWHIISPFKFVTDYPISTETVEVNDFNISTRDGKTVNVDISYSYRMDFDELPDIFTKFRGRSENTIEDGYMRDRLKESCNVISTNMDVLEVYGDKRQELNNNVYIRFENQLKDLGIILETFAFTRIEADKESMKAIQQKVDAKQKLERMKIEKEQAIVEAEKKKILVEADVERKLISSKAYAERKKIESEAISKANDVINQSLTEKVLKNEKIKKWNGEYPKVVGSESIIYNLD